MKITLCGSIAFIDKMSAFKGDLIAKGHEVKMPPTEITLTDGRNMSAKDFYTMRNKAKKDDDMIWVRKRQAIFDHNAKIAWCDAIIVVNEDKNGITGYIGPNTFLEIGLAFYLGKKIYCLNPLPDMNITEELWAMPIMIWEQ